MEDEEKRRCRECGRDISHRSTWASKCYSCEEEDDRMYEQPWDDDPPAPTPPVEDMDFNKGV